VAAYFPDFVEAGIDILNPVQISAAGMGAEGLKRDWGDKFVFWGGAVNAQGALAFGKPEEVRAEALANIATFGKGGGFVYNNVHNIQATVPTENMLALLRAVTE